MTVCINGKFYSDKQAKVPILDHGYLYGDGAFTTLRTYNGKLFHINEHLQRLQESCKIIKLEMPYPTTKIIGWAKKCCLKSKLKEARARISVTRGVGEVPIQKTYSCKPILSIIVSRLPRQEPKNYGVGVKIVLVRMERVLPKSKNMNFLPSVMAMMEATKKKAFEAVFVNTGGYATEGTTSNLFAVKNGVLATPKDDILEGITRKIVLKLAKKEGIKTQSRALKAKELLQADEVFLAGTTKEIVPVTRIGKMKVNNGRPGEVTQRLMRAFRRYVDGY